MEETAAMTVQQYLGLEVPGDLPGITDLVHAEVAGGRRAALRIAILVAEARRQHYADDPAAWLTWCRDEFGYERRHSFTCLAAGMLLLTPGLGECGTAALVECDPTKLELLARIPGHQLPPLLERWNPAKATRDQVRAKARLWSDASDTSDSSDADSAKAPRRPARRPRAGNLADALSTLAGWASREAAEQRQAAAAIDPMIAFRAGFGALNLALHHLEATGLRLTEAQAEALRRLYAETGVELTKLGA